MNDAKDLAARLRSYAASLEAFEKDGGFTEIGMTNAQVKRRRLTDIEAADLIEQQAAEVEAQREMLRQLRDVRDELAAEHYAMKREIEALMNVLQRCSRIMRGGECVQDQGEAYDRTLEVLDAAIDADRANVAERDRAFAKKLRGSDE